MELNAEMNKIFGQEMAKLFAATISEEELQRKAREVWKDLNRREDSWGGRREPEIERFIKEEILKRLYEKIQAILEEPVSDEILEKKAREMVEAARKAGEEAIVKDMAKHMVNNALSVYGRSDEIVCEVLQRLNLQQQRNTGY